MKEIYLDNCSTTKPYIEVVDEMLKTLTNNYGNPSSLHKLGFEAEKIVKHSRKIISDSISSKPEEIYFTSGGTEANNLAIIGFAMANKKRGNHIITTKIEHPSVLNVYNYLEEQGFNVTYLNVDSKGLIDMGQLKSSLSENTILVSIMFVNNEIGCIQPIEEIGRLIKKTYSNICFHVDAVQAYGKIKININAAKIDLLASSGHKIHGPKGIGFIYVKKGLNIKPIVYGGNQELSLRSGTENVPGIAGLGKAVEISFNNLDNNYIHVKRLKEKLVEKLMTDIDDVFINSPVDEHVSAFILNISFKNIKSEVLLHALEVKGIYISTGSACSSNKPSKSHVLKAIGQTDSLIDGSIRCSFSHCNTIDEMEEAGRVIKGEVEKLRKFIRR